MVIDAVSGGEITATAEVRGTSPFEVDINILEATPGYQAYQYYLGWDPNVLALDDHRDLKPAGLDVCPAPIISADMVGTGCFNVSEATTFAGPVSTITFHCVGDGTSVLHLLTSADDPVSYSTTLAPRAYIISTELTDASVTCVGSYGGEETGPTEVAAPVVTPSAFGEGTAAMVVDAVSGGEITATAEVRGTSPFEVDINILEATPGYQAYQYYLGWDPNVLALDDHRDLKPAGLDLCPTPIISADMVGTGCFNVSETTTFAGPVSTITFHCVGDGTSVLHLLTSADDPVSYSTTLAPRAYIISTELTDASVTCVGS